MIGEKKPGFYNSLLLLVSASSLILMLTFSDIDYIKKLIITAMLMCMLVLALGAELFLKSVGNTRKIYGLALSVIVLTGYLLYFVFRLKGVI